MKREEGMWVGLRYIWMIDIDELIDDLIVRGIFFFFFFLMSF